LQDIRALLDQTGREFCAAVGKPGREVEWRAVLDYPTEVVTREARAADLVVIASSQQKGISFRSLHPGIVIVKAGRPVLTVPRGLHNRRNT
jgi:hypothetical protein